MTLTIEDVVTHYILSSHPTNRAIIDIKDKKSGDLRYIKIRHRLPKFYAVSLVDPVTFEVWAETQAKSASTRTKPIVLHSENKDAKDTSVEFRESSRIGFEWTFSWEGEKYKWVRESRMSNILECKAIRKTGDICVAQYLPRMLKDEYFGIFSLLGYNILRCKLTKSRELELIILMSLMTLLDKSNDGSWKKDQVSKGLVQEDIFESYRKKETVTNEEDSVVLPIAYEDPIPKKAQQKKYRTELLNDQKLQLLLERDVKRSQKQIQSDQKSHKKPSISAGNSPAHSPKASPLPTPSSSTNLFRSPILTRQKSASALSYNTPSTSNDSSTQNSPTESHDSSNGRLTKLFSNMKQSSAVTFTDPLSPKEPHIDYQVKQRANKHREQEHLHQLSLPIGYTAAQFTNEFGKLSIQSRKQENPPSLRSIRWNPEPYVQQQQQQPQFRSANNSIRRPRMDDRRRMSASEYVYHQNYHVRYPSNEYFIHPYQQTNHFDYY